MSPETQIDTIRFRLMLKWLFAGRATAGAALGLAVAMSIPCIAGAQDQYPPPAQEQYPYPPPAQGQYQYPPPAYAQPVVPVAPPGAVWVGEPGECLYGARAVYWCAPGVVFTGFPVGWDFGRYPVVSIAPGIVVDPIWFGGWRRSHPGFVFRGRAATDVERRGFLERRQEIIRNRNPERRERRREEERR
jgi:hypothetical protein